MNQDRDILIIAQQADSRAEESVRDLVIKAIAQTNHENETYDQE